MGGDSEIRIAAAVIVDDHRRVLLVRKRGTAAFMQPGGKLENAEAPTACLARELYEEIRVRVTEADMTRLGVFRAIAANEANTMVHAELFSVRGVKRARPAAEIAEAIWFAPDGGGDHELAPLTRDAVIPLMRRAWQLEERFV